jgi:hypothetical protein
MPEAMRKLWVSRPLRRIVGAVPGPRACDASVRSKYVALAITGGHCNLWWCRWISRSCITTTTSPCWTRRTSWPPCPGSAASRRPHWFACAAVPDLPELSPAHRLDRLTAGVLLFATRPIPDLVRPRAGAQDMSRAGGHRSGPGAAEGRAQSNHQAAWTRTSRRGPGEPNAETLIERLGDGHYRLPPRIGRTPDGVSTVGASSSGRTL